MKTVLLSCIAAVLFMVSCSGSKAPARVHDEANGVYYWKTTLRPDSSLYAFIRRHDVGRIYLRVFDVTANDGRGYGEEAVVPNATLRFVIDEPWAEWTDSVPSETFTPTVFITLDAMKAMAGHEGEWADKIVTRALNICSYNKLPRVEGLQLDCDWTPSTETSYFALCDSAGALLRHKLPDAKLSSIIRLHQLARKAPPADYGVLMVYNTGSFDNPDERNSIIDIETVRP